MSDAKPTTDDRLSILDEDERAWLDQQLEEYAELLKYLHDH